MSTPLFEGFSPEELVAVIHGLKLLNFAPGDILVAEGGRGDSLFILASGSVKAFVRNPKGDYVKVNELGEGAFFGEIAMLTGRPRTATITAAGTAYAWAQIFGQVLARCSSTGVDSVGMNLCPGGALGFREKRRL